MMTLPYPITFCLHSNQELMLEGHKNVHGRDLSPQFFR
jgi:hypothetical protein